MFFLKFFKMFPVFIVAIEILFFVIINIKYGKDT